MADEPRIVDTEEGPALLLPPGAGTADRVWEMLRRLRAERDSGKGVGPDAKQTSAVGRVRMVDRSAGVFGLQTGRRSVEVPFSESLLTPVTRALESGEWVRITGLAVIGGSGFPQHFTHLDKLEPIDPLDAIGDEIDAAHGESLRKLA
jgi:hypothetical protein